MKRLLFILLILTVTVSSCKKERNLHMVNIPNGRGIEKAEKLGMQLNMQSITFIDTALVSVFEKLEELGIKNIEIAPNHTIGGKWGDKQFNETLPLNDIEELKSLAASHQVRIVGIGVYQAKDKGDWQQIFSFAQSVGVEYIIAEPNSEDLSIVNSLSLESGIKVGIHNSLQPSEYWNATSVLNKIDFEKSNLRLCADVANWNKAGLDQIECLEQLEGRIQSVHFKDIDYKKQDEAGLEYQQDVTWGTGILDIDAMMIELKRQKYNSYITIKFEKQSERLMLELKDCIFYYDLVADEFL